jgi:regulation of enolase protein 1 (concanavalin A-like superfamily)
MIFTKPGRYLLGKQSQSNGDEVQPWGDVIDPGGDCTLAPKDGALQIEVPGVLHDLNSEIGKWNAPRVIQEFDGDFVVQVKVCGEFQPGAPSTRNDALPYNGAGLILWLDNERFIRMERGAVTRDRRVGAFLLFERHDFGQPVLRKNGFLEEGDVYLKIERRGSQVSGSYSTDGQQWVEAEPISINWPARLKVGLDAVNSAFTSLSVRFEEFSIRKLKGK